MAAKKTTNLGSSSLAVGAFGIAAVMALCRISCGNKSFLAAFAR